MYLVAIAWLYVVVLMALAEGTSNGGTWLGAFFTLVLYGALPLGIAMYLLGTPARRRARQRAAGVASVAAPAVVDPDRGAHAAGDAVAAKREEP
jgi:hypothetical protein